MKNREMFKKGLRLGMPIGLGYFPVSFTFGFLTVAGGLPWWIGVFISLTNLTSAGQFAGLNLILAGAGYVEVAMTTFIINLRYMLMSLSLSQSIEPAVPVWQRYFFFWDYGRDFCHCLYGEEACEGGFSCLVL